MQTYKQFIEKAIVIVDEYKINPFIENPERPATMEEVQKFLQMKTQYVHTLKQKLNWFEMMKKEFYKDVLPLSEEELAKQNEALILEEERRLVEAKQEEEAERMRQNA